MVDKVPLILSVITLCIVIIFNIASLAVVDWYVAESKTSIAGTTIKGTGRYGLVSYQGCAETSGNTDCSTTDYDDVDTSGMDDDAKGDLKQTQAGGGLAILFLLLNLLLCVVLMVLSLIMLIGCMVVISKNPLIVPKLIWIPLLTIPLQLIALFWWTVLFGYYNVLDDADTATIGSGIGLLIVSILLPIIIFLINKFVLKQSTSVVQ